MVLITGSTGFVGPYLIKELKSFGYQVTGTAVSGDADYLLDITDKKAVADLIRKLKPDLIVHLAGFSSVKESFKSPELCMKVNVQGTGNLLDAVKEYVPVARILIISSSEVYGNTKITPTKEIARLNPQNPYAESRVAQEEQVKNSGLNWIISRSFNHIGPGQPQGFVASDFASQIAKINKDKQVSPFIYVGNLSAQRDFTDVRDVVAAYRLLLTKGKLHNIYNVCSGKAIRIENLLKKLLKFSKVKIEIKVDKDKLKPIEVKKTHGDNSKLKKELKWRPKVSIDKTLEDIYRYWLARV